jgi:REP element-mobilizing transposase RayT
VPRSHRNLTTDNRFHIINRGVDSQDLFSIDDDWNLFESMIGRVCADYGFRLNAYALMSNHYHVLADLSDCDDRDGVSNAMRVLQSTYAKYFNDRTERRGPLFEPRFLSYGVDGDTKTHRSVRYIHRNPIDICGPKALGNYRWSSLPVLLGRRRSPSWLDCSLFAPSDPTAHLADLTDCRVADLWPLGPNPPQRPTTIDAIEQAVRSLPPSFAEPKLHRPIVALLSLELRASDVVELASHFDRSPTSIRQMAARARTKRRDEPSFDRLVDRIEHELLRNHP